MPLLLPAPRPREPQRLDSRQLLALQQLQRGSASGREPVHPIGEAELLERRDRVAAADHGGRPAPGNRLGEGPGAVGERLQLEGAHRPVPEHRPRGGDLGSRTPARCAGRCRGPSSRRAPRCPRPRGARSPPSKRSPSTRSTGSRSSQSEPRPSPAPLPRARPPPPRPASRRSEIPWARKKLKHIAPPIRISSAISRKRSITPILSLTLAPPSTTTSGRSGSSTTRSARSTSRSSSSPA